MGGAQRADERTTEERSKQAIDDLSLACHNTEFTYLGCHLPVTLINSDAEYSLAIAQTIVGPDNSRIADALAGQNTLHHDILRHADMLITRKP